MTTIDTKLAPGALQLYDYYKPPLEAGTYRIEVTQTLITEGNSPHTFLAEQEFAVLAPQFSFDASQIINQYPPSGSTGPYGEVLPHIVLKDPMLAWERLMKDKPRPTPSMEGEPAPIPWLALLVFDETELEAGENPDTKATTTSVKKFLALNDSRAAGNRILVPPLVPEVDIVLADAPQDSTSPQPSTCQYITMKREVFQRVAPHLEELRYLTHVRKVDTGARPLLGLNEHGLFTVIMANRFASVPDNQPSATGQVVARKNIVHLVSVEGMEQYLADGATLTDANDPAHPYAEVALISLASWTFSSQPDQLLDFKDLAKNLVGGNKGEARWLQLPLPAELQPGATSPAGYQALNDNQKEVFHRLNLGYAPLAYHTRSGEDTFAWYRGPLATQPTSDKGLRPFFTADSALIYTTAFDVFDVSVAAAWELGREVALADVAFGPTLLHFRRKAAQIIDTLHHQLASGHFPNELSELQVQRSMQDIFKDLLAAGTLNTAAIGAVGTQPADNATLAAARATAITIPTASSAPRLRDGLELWMTNETYTKPALSQFRQLLAEDIASLGSWLGKLLLLQLVPFDNLVPDERMLPAESLRFFYLDENWFSAVLDGALSLGLDSSRHTYLHTLVKDMMVEEARQAASLDRLVAKAQETGNSTPELPALPVLPNGISGFLLRSDMVAGWPNLAVHATDAVGSTGQPVNILRIDHLAPDVLLCLFDGVPVQLKLSEPSESLRFGVDEDGMVALRNPTAALVNSIPTGGQLAGSLIPIWDNKNKTTLQCMRTLGSRVLDISKLVQTLNNSFSPAKNLGPGAFSLQMIKAAESLALSPPVAR